MSKLDLNVLGKNRAALIEFSEQEGWDTSGQDELCHGCIYRRINRDAEEAWIGLAFMEFQDLGEALLFSNPDIFNECKVRLARKVAP
jgi:hypothetical protein